MIQRLVRSSNLYLVLGLHAVKSGKKSVVQKGETNFGQTKFAQHQLWPIPTVPFFLARSILVPSLLGHIEKQGKNKKIDLKTENR